MNSLHELPYAGVNLNRDTGNAASFYNDAPYWGHTTHVIGWALLKN